MSLILSGTDGLSDIDGTAATPAIRGTDANTGIFFGADIIGFSEGGVEAARINADSQFVAAAGTAALPVITTTGDLNTGIFFPAADTIAFSEGGAEAMRIDSSGNLLVNTTSNVGANAKIFAVGSGQGIAVGYGTGSSAYRHLYMNNADATLYFFNDTNYANLSPSGAWTNASDARLKKNIVDIKYGIADVLRLQPRSYQMNSVEGDFVGFIAQELQTVIPEVVTGDPEKQLGVDYGSLVAVAFKAIQEQQALITQLQADVAALKAK
jgi:hypothetical protein